MALPTNLIDKWAMPAPNEKATQTYKRFKEIIEGIYGNDVEVFLQGSYANTTNIKGESDVDIVMLFNNATVSRTFTPNYFGNASTNLQVQDVKNNAFNRLNSRSGFYLTNGAKTIKYAGNQDYLPVDLVPCAVYKGTVIGDNGIAIYDTQKGQIFYNYPKQHIGNGQSKNGNTNGNYKKTVRMFKCAKEKAIDKNLLHADHAPSYFIECLIYNVPNSCFTGTNIEIFKNVIQWLLNNKNNLSNFKCQNGKHDLFESFSIYRNSGYTYKRWNVNNAQIYIDSIVKLWNEWGQL